MKRKSSQNWSVDFPLTKTKANFPHHLSVVFPLTSERIFAVLIQPNGSDARRSSVAKSLPGGQDNLSESLPLSSNYSGLGLENAILHSLSRHFVPPCRLDEYGPGLGGGHLGQRQSVWSYGFHLTPLLRIEP